MINRAYGVLTNGVVPCDAPGYRYTDVKCPGVVRSNVSALMGLAPVEHRGVFANILIDLMRSSALWPDYVRKYDPNNTYQTEVLEACVYEGLQGITFDDIVKWADSVTHRSEEFNKTKHDTAIDRVCNALFSVASVDLE